jgi:flavin reductase (DIM6/NTAB) family NADH-FMN oxidoreductase RutF
VRRLCDPADARRLLNPGPVGIVTTAWRGNTNAAPIAWMTPLSIDPPLVGCAIQPERHTAAMIRFSGAFAINIPGPSLLKQTAFLGAHTGLDTNKLEAAGLQLFRPLTIDAPLIEGCLAWIECIVEDAIRLGDHTLFVAEPVKVQADDEAYAGHWLLQTRDWSPLTFIGGNRYAIIGDPLEATYQVDEHGGLVTETAEEREARLERQAHESELRRLEGDEGYRQRLQTET